MSQTLIGVYQNLNGGSVSVQALVDAVSSTLGASVPADLQVTLRNAAFAYTDGDASSNMLVAVAIGGGLNLADLPVVGAAFSQSQTLRFDIQLFGAESSWTTARLQQVNALIPSPALPFPAAAANAGSGISTSCTLTLGDTVVALDLPFDPSTYHQAAASQPSGSQTSGSRATDTATINWYPVQRSLGPVMIQQAGVGYASGLLTIYLDAQLAIAGLTITLDALSFSTELQNLDPTLGLEGLGLQYDGDGIAIGAAMLNAGGEVYAGIASIDTDAFSLSAIGAYAPNANGDPSVVIYAFVGGLDAGPPCLTITGLAAAFGYNRGLVLPPLSGVAGFPLVAAAQQGQNVLSAAATSMQSPQSNGLASALSALDTDFPPTEGANFVGFGVQFSSFEMVRGFLLLTASFGQGLSIDLLGLATATFPIPDDDQSSPLALIQLALIASWQPAAGSFLLQSQINPASYVISTSCRLSGGIDAALWYGDSPQAGDFAFSAGGYHPAFKPPSYYPVPARLALRWQVSSDLLVSGQAYFAFCPHALMAGASVQAVWSSGDLEADFQMAFDFLIGWKPFSYSADLDESLTVTYHGSIFGIRISLSLELGAALTIWGPDFSGTAHVDVEGIGFTLDFGDAPQGDPAPITWSQFQSSFLPANGIFWSQSVTGGATPSSAAPASGNLGIVNARDLEITVRSAVPLASLVPSGGTAAAGAAVGIAPMGTAIGQANAAATLKITDRNGDDVTSAFAVTPLNQSVPSGLWGGSLVPAPNDPLLIAGALAGCTLTPAAAAASGTTSAIPVEVLRSDIQPQPDAFAWDGVTIPAVVADTDAQRRTQIATAIAAAASTQETLIAALGLPITVDCAASIARVFMIAPQIVAPSAGTASVSG